MKLLVETTGPFMLVDYGHGAVEIQAHRPSVVENSSFVNARTLVGQIRLISQVKDEATDAEFEKFLKDSDGKMDLAVDSFLAQYGIREEVSKKPAPKVPGKAEK